MALPAIIQTIVSAIGHADAMSLVQVLGGRTFRFPAGKSSDNWLELVDIVGPISASRLIEIFGGTDVYIALCDRAIRDDRNRRMVTRYDELLRQGQSSRRAINKLVKEFRLSDRMVKNIMNRPMPSMVSDLVAQGSLF